MTSQSLEHRVSTKPSPEQLNAVAGIISERHGPVPAPVARMLAEDPAVYEAALVSVFEPHRAGSALQDAISAAWLRRPEGFTEYLAANVAERDKLGLGFTPETRKAIAAEIANFHDRTARAHVDRIKQDPKAQVAALKRIAGALSRGNWDAIAAMDEALLEYRDREHRQMIARIRPRTDNSNQTESAKGTDQS